ncbi:transmembrane protein 183 [Eurytemora carolleeae]|uniref:transmembrane protein 183 n=1 Tax=Eurytemora carolleeae TaxID=1294199 RepID=UPI000C76ACA8|nr:transmembrane protein 183 [Eurytemora carolleeae]|eukprot:XP_023343364.1 transmembrane protein 183-like [Eurytemora affinis]
MRMRSIRNYKGLPADVTLNSFANSVQLRDREPKYQPLVHQIKQTEERRETREVELDWFDRDEDDIAAEVKMLNVGTCKEVGPPSLEFSSSVFPYDFWFLLSGFIAPEDVGRFASISPLTRHIVSSQAFWRRLYSRYFSPELELSSAYSPESMSRPLGLRARVILMLHLSYSPFRAIKNQSSVWPDLDKLVGRVCTLHWSSKLSRSQCFFYFKLKDQFITENKSKHQEYFVEEWEEINVDKGFLDKLSDINHNPENGCKLLQVCCANWCLFPSPLSQKLKRVSVSVSHGMKHHKLQMEFGGPRGQSGDIKVLIDSVVSLKVLDWWDPQYSNINNNFVK